MGLPRLTPRRPPLAGLLLVFGLASPAARSPLPVKVTPVTSNVLGRKFLFFPQHWTLAFCRAFPLTNYKRPFPFPPPLGLPLRPPFTRFPFQAALHPLESDFFLSRFSGHLFPGFCLLFFYSPEVFLIYSLRKEWIQKVSDRAIFGCFTQSASDALFEDNDFFVFDLLE